MDSENEGKSLLLFPSGEDAVPINIDGQSIQIKPDHPVESMTWWSALVFANKLSQEHGLKPTYDLSDIVWDPGTRASNGTLLAKSGEIKINAPNGDYYKSEGYRLPTEAEQEYMLRAAGTMDGMYYFGDNEGSDS